ncbi:MAG: germination protein YpeB [Clostridia bacterium]
MKKSTIILSSALVVAIGFSIYFHDLNDTSSTSLKFDSDRAFSELVSSVSKMNTALSKSVYSTTPSYSISMLAEVYSLSETAKSNLAQLPNVNNDMAETYQFISTVGDYSLAMMKKIANGDDLDNDEQSNIEMLAKKTDELSQELSDIKTLYNSGDIEEYILRVNVFDNFDEVENLEKSELDSEIEPEAQEFATLIYDGPFSSHINKLEPEFLKDEYEISKEQAQNKVAEFLQTPAENVLFISQIDGQIPVYKFQSSKEDDEISIDVTIKGGHILNFINYREVSESTLNAQQCVEIAKNMLIEKGYINIIETYYIDLKDTVTINFAFTQDGVVLYPDLLKIEIYKDDGTLAGVEARGYIMSHTEREDLTEEISLSKAREVVSSKLEIVSEGMAIIPSSGQNEVLVYEFKCQNENQDNYIVYVNAKTGQIQNILILIEDETGTLTM